jgi:DNA polymerase IIIc chi subunit
LMAVLRRICDFLHTAIRNGGRVLVYCSSEFRANVIVCAYRESPNYIVICE